MLEAGQTNRFWLPLICSPETGGAQQFGLGAPPGFLRHPNVRLAHLVDRQGNPVHHLGTAWVLAGDLESTAVVDGCPSPILEAGTSRQVVAIGHGVECDEARLEQVGCVVDGEVYGSVELGSRMSATIESAWSVASRV